MAHIGEDRTEAWRLNERVPSEVGSDGSALINAPYQSMAKTWPGRTPADRQTAYGSVTIPIRKEGRRDHVAFVIDIEHAERAHQGPAPFRDQCG